MMKGKTYLVGKFSILMTATVSTLILFVAIGGEQFFSDKSSADNSWFRSFNIEIETGSIMTLQDDAKFNWNFREHWQPSPSLQHSTIAFNNTYTDARYFQFKDGKVQIRDAHRIVYEKNLGKEFSIPVFQFTSDLEKFFFVASRWDEPGISSKYVVITKDWMSEEFNAVSLPIFSDDSEHLSFGGQKVTRSIFTGIPASISLQIILNKKVIAIHEGEMRTSTNLLSVFKPVTAFHPMNNKIAYIYNDTGSPYTEFGGEAFVVFDGKKEEKFSAIPDVPIFSDDGSSMAYAGHMKPIRLLMSGPENVATAVCNGLWGPRAAFIRNIVLNSDGTICAHIGKLDNVGSQLVVNGKIVNHNRTEQEGENFNQEDYDIYDLMISPKNTIAYKRAILGGFTDTQYIHVGEQIYGPYSGWRGFLELRACFKSPFETSSRA
jgi:hypothetical protein